MDEKKKSISIILEKLKPSPMPKEDSDEHEMDEKMAMAEEILSAIESKDASALKDALESLIEVCKYSEEE